MLSSLALRGTIWVLILFAFSLVEACNVGFPTSVDTSDLRGSVTSSVHPVEGTFDLLIFSFGLRGTSGAEADPAIGL